MLKRALLSLHLAVLLAVALPMSVFAQATTNSKPAPKGKIDLSFIPGEAAGVLVLHPKRALAAPEMALMPVEILTAQSKQVLGLDAAEIEQAIAFAAPQGAGEPLAGVILRMAKPIQRQELLPPLLPAMTEAQYAGRKYLRGPTPPFISLCLIDDKTLLAATESSLKQMLDAKPWDTGAHKLLGELDPSTDLALLVSVDTLRPLIGLAMLSLPQPPPAYRDFLKVPSLLSAVEIQCTFGSGAKSTLTLRGVDTDSTQELEKLTIKGLTLGKEEILKSVPPSKPDDLMGLAAEKYLRRILAKSDEWLKPVRTGDRLTLTLHHAAFEASPATTGMMVALLVPAVQQTRQAARRVQSSNTMKQLLLAMHSYVLDKRTFPARANFDKQGRPLLSWRVHLLPYLEQQALYQQFKLDEPWDSEHNRKLIPLIPALYQTKQRMDGKTSYLVPTGKGCMFEGNQAIKLQDIPDGTSNTAALVEADDDQAVIWTQPADLMFDPEKPLAGLGKAWPGGFHIGFADGTVRMIGPEIDPNILKAIFTYKGGEVLGGN